MLVISSYSFLQSMNVGSDFYIGRDGFFFRKSFKFCSGSNLIIRGLNFIFFKLFISSVKRKANSTT